MKGMTVVRHVGRWASLVALGFSFGVASAAETVRPAAPKADLPKEVSEHLKRRAGCNHWAGEDPYDPARGREIAAAVRNLHCDRLDESESRLRQRYRMVPAIRKALDQARNAEG